MIEEGMKLGEEKGEVFVNEDELIGVELWGEGVGGTSDRDEIICGEGADSEEEVG